MRGVTLDSSMNIHGDLIVSLHTAHTPQMALLRRSTAFGNLSTDSQRQRELQTALQEREAGPHSEMSYMSLTGSKCRVAVAAWAGSSVAIGRDEAVKLA